MSEEVGKKYSTRLLYKMKKYYIFMVNEKMLTVSVQLTCSHYDELLEEIGKYAEGYEAERIYKVDLAILLLAVYEIKFMNDIPFKVSVDEAVNIANKYSTGKSGKYINGILAKIKR